MNSKPDILWIMTDEQRPDSLGCYGSAWARTPNIDAIAARGTVMRNAVCASPMCLPSRSAQHTARYPQEFACLNNLLGAKGAGFPPGYVTFPEILRNAGYETVNFGRLHTLSKTVFDQSQGMGDTMPGTAGYCNLDYRYDEQRYHVVHRPGKQNLPLILAGTYPGLENPSQITNERAISFLRRRKSDRPLFLCVSYNWPHTPTLAVPPFDRLYDPDRMPIRYFDRAARDCRSRFDRVYAELHGMDLLSRDQIRQVWKDYMGCCAYIDSLVGQLLTALDEAGMTEDTIVFCNADHGKSLGEWGTGEKGTFDREVWRVPFIWSSPGRIPEGKVRDDPCGTIDTARTLLCLAGLEDRIPETWRGRDLFGSEPPAQAAFGIIRPPPDEIPDFGPDLMRVAVLTQRFRMDLNWRTDGRPAPPEAQDGNLFDLTADPFETRNLWTDPAYRSHVEDLSARIQAWLDQHDVDPRLKDPRNAGVLF